MVRGDHDGRFIDMFGCGKDVGFQTMPCTAAGNGKHSGTLSSPLKIADDWGMVYDFLLTTFRGWFLCPNGSHHPTIKGI